MLIHALGLRASCVAAPLLAKSHFAALMGPDFSHMIDLVTFTVVLLERADCGLKDKIDS